MRRCSSMTAKLVILLASFPVQAHIRAALCVLSSYQRSYNHLMIHFMNSRLHKMACSWSSDNKTVSTSSMDGTVKLCRLFLPCLALEAGLNATAILRGCCDTRERTNVDRWNRRPKPTSWKYLGGRRRYCFLVAVRRPQRFRSAGRK